MIDITDLKYTAPLSAPPGSLLIQAAKAPTYAALLTIGGGGPRNALTIDNGERGFRIVNGHVAHAPFLQIAEPRFVVDHASMLNGFDGAPEPGTLFISPQGTGIVGTADYSELGVLLDGTLIDQIEYAAFAGFRHWRIEVGDRADPLVFFTYRHPTLNGSE